MVDETSQPSTQSLFKALDYVLEKHYQSQNRLTCHLVSDQEKKILTRFIPNNRAKEMTLRDSLLAYIAL